MAKDIGYLDDEEEVASRKIPPPSPIFLEPPMHAEDPRDRDIRLRQQLLIDEERKLAATTAKDYKEKFASDYPKAIAIIYSLVSETIRKDLSRAVENAVPPITNNETKYRKIRERLQDKWGPNSQKDAEELRRKLTNLQGDARGWDIYLIALDDIIQVLAKTAKRDSANNPLLEPVPLRPPLPRPPINSTLAGFQAHFAADLANELAWDALHPAGAFQNHKPTDDAIKNIVIMALADSQHECYSSMANRYRQTDHATKTWPELRADVESMIQNNHKGTSKDPDIFSNRHSRRIIYDEVTQPPQKYIRAARDTSPNHYDPFPPYEPTYYIRDPPTQQSSTRAASYPPNPSTSLAPNRPNCVNCGGDHAGRDCDSLTCSKCQGTFPSAALRQAHYLAAHARVKIIAPDSSILRKQTKYNTNRNTPPTSPFMQRSAASTPTDHSYNQPPSSALPEQAPDDSGYDSVFSNASTTDYQDPVYDDSAIAADYLREVPPNV